MPLIRPADSSISAPAEGGGAGVLTLMACCASCRAEVARAAGSAREIRRGLRSGFVSFLLGVVLERLESRGGPNLSVATRVRPLFLGGLESDSDPDGH